jgi:unsaturated rhamnogalacturonyl hydrolase
MIDSIMARSPLLSQKWEYECGLVLKGIWELWRRTNESRYFDYVRENIDHFVSDDGTIRTYKQDDFNIDNINNGKILLRLYEHTGLEKYKKALMQLSGQLEKHPRTNAGGFWHKKIYPYQMWLDGIYMACPFIAEYGAASRNSVLFDETAKQIELVAKLTKDPVTGLHYHGYDESRKEEWANPDTGCSPNFWGRSIGWFAMALIDSLDFIPVDHPRWKPIMEILASLLKACINVRDHASGLWFQVMDKPDGKGNYLEASVSCMLTYAFIKAARKGYVPDEYLEQGLRSYDGAVAYFIVEEDDGTISLDRICRVAGLGNVPYRDGSYEYYISEPIVKNDYKGTGAFILASLEAENALG